MAGLNLEDEEDEAFLLPIDPEVQKLVYEYRLVSELGERRFLFKFFHELDIKRVVEGAP
ncbi:hypothetical protein Goari_026957 [Gossypium aridum]|uniref:Uncharacterized protein n=1 Tax=Gossypium aridum TaxID=34290 RepID=A0A7J8YU89_GOSAI|nr:hypothetical protein [Gossypium aridum]